MARSRLMSTASPHRCSKKNAEVNSAAESLLKTLHEERAAARDADLGRLEELQETKRKLVAALRDHPCSDEERDRIAEVAHENIGLMRHLTNMIQGILGADAGVGYRANGKSVAPPHMKTDRGVL